MRDNLEARELEAPSPGRITRAGQALTAWLQRLAPDRRLMLGLQRPEPAPYLPNNRARVRARKAHRHAVQSSRRNNR